MRPADQDLSCGDRADAEQIEKLGGQLSYQREDLVLEILGLGLQSLDALGCGSQSPGGHPVLDALRRSVAELSTTDDLCRALELS